MYGPSPELTMNMPYAQPSFTGPAEDDRRLHSRYNLHVQIEIRPEGSDVPMRLETSDLSRGGCYIQTMMAFAIGTHVRATLWLDDLPVIVRGEVVTCHPQFGNGIMFVQFIGNGQHLLNHYLDTIIAAQTPPPDSPSL